MFIRSLRCGAALLALCLPVSACWAQQFSISSLTGDDTPGGIYSGSPVSLTVTIKNRGPAASGWQAAVQIPPGYDFVDPKPCGGTVQAPPACRGNAPDAVGSNYLLYPDDQNVNSPLPVGGTSTCTIQLRATSTGGADAANVAIFASPHSRCGTNSTDAQSYNFTTTRVPTTDVSISLGASASSAAVGTTFDYTLTATNGGRQDAPNAQTVFNFPASLSVVPKSCQGASTTGGTAITWNASIPYGNNASCVLTATVLSGAGTVATATAQITPSGMSDPNNSNNNASTSVSLVPAPQADVSATIAADSNTIASGSIVNFTINAANAGPQDATAAQVSASFSTELALLSSSCVSGTPGNPLTWNIGTLTAGTSKTCTVQAQLGVTPLTSVSANVSITSQVGDPNSGNNISAIVVAVQQSSGGSPNLSIGLSGATPGRVYRPGEALHLTATVSNASATTGASGVVATIHVRHNGDLNGLSSSCGSFDSNGKLLWNVGTVGANGSQTCSIDTTIAGSSRVIPISAHLDANAPGDLDNLTAALLVPVNPAPKRISVTASGAPTTRDSSHVVLSSDGSTALFQSQETQLVAGNPNINGQDIYRIGSDGKPVLESIDHSGHQLMGGSNLPALSGDGSLIAFSNNNAAFFTAKSAKDFSITGQMWAGGAGQPKQQVDTTPSGGAPNGPSIGGPSVSTAGGAKKLVVFCSSASNLVANDKNGANDVFLVDLNNPSQPTQLVSTDSTGAQLPGDSCEPKLSGDGTKVVFSISSPTLYRTSARQIVRKDLATGALDLISLNTTPGGPGGGADSTEPTINSDGSVIAFTSGYDFDGLGAPVGGHEVFVSLAEDASDGASRVVRRARSSDGTVPNGASQHAQLSDDGNVMMMQSLATNFFGAGKADSGTAACGTVAITTNFFTPASMGSGLCGGQTQNQNPSISGDGTAVGFDSNVPQSGTSSSNSNAYTQPLAGTTVVGKSASNGDFSGQWFDPTQSGQGLVIDVLPAQSNGDHNMSVIWFVYRNGTPTWLIGSGVPHASGGNTVLQMNQVGIFQGRSFPIGETNATATLWGSITVTFADANTAMMTWTTGFPGFNSGAMPLSHFLPVSLPANDAAGAQVKACYSGNWKEPTKSGHGFEFEVIPSSPPQLAVDWFAYSPSGAPVWLQGAAPISGNGAQVPMQLIDGNGAQFPPLFNTATISQHSWGTVNVTFSDAGHAHATWNSTISGYGQGSIDLVPTFGLERRTCQ